MHLSRVLSRHPIELGKITGNGNMLGSGGCARSGVQGRAESLLYLLRGIVEIQRLDFMSWRAGRNFWSGK